MFILSERKHELYQYPDVLTLSPGSGRESVLGWYEIERKELYYVHLEEIMMSQHHSDLSSKEQVQQQWRGTPVHVS